jgi:hypothetical protein
VASLRSVGWLAFVAVVATSAAATPSRRVPTDEFTLRRLGTVSVEVDGIPTPAVGWRIAADPDFLSTIPRELLARGADPSSGAMDLVLRVAPDHPAVARIERMIREMFAAWSAGPERIEATDHPASQAALPMGIDPCIDSCEVYSCDGAGDLVRIRSDLVVSPIGNMGVTMLDIAVSRDRHLYGISGGQLYLISTCNAEVTLLGPSTFGGALCADITSDGLFAEGPPLEHVPLPATLPDAIGGSCCGAPPSWYEPADDICESDERDRLYACLGGGSCGGDTLVAIDAATGSVVEEVSCPYDFITLQPISDVSGIAFPGGGCNCLLLVGFRDSGVIYVVDPTTGLGAGLFQGGGIYSGTFGFATLPTLLSCSQPPSCDATADPAGCSSVRLHANASDPDGDPLAYLWTTSCAGAAFAPSFADADPLVTVDAGCGTCTFDLAVADGNGGRCSDSVDVAFDDVVPPVVDATALVACLWPPNHRLVDIGLTASASDDCAAPGDLAVSITSVTSDEATATEPGAGGAANEPDAIVDGLSVKVRAERSGLSDGRVYRITVKAVDPCGNEGEAVVEVRVPHDHDLRSAGRRRGNDPDDLCVAIDSGQQHDATVRN